ncbi:MAG: T9SS type A sorting domain-containing protein [Saprospirales bacterium]|nr:T9SS type A sorting domain-containing protein [Saprospirales bacterium]
MKKAILGLSFLVFSVLYAFSQPYCTGSGRYVDSLFACVDISNDLQFGTGVKDWGWGNILCLDLNLPPYNTQLSLRCDVYEPCGDTLSARPLIIAIHGGAWASGNKNDFAAFGELMAKKGYVVASINYRLSLPDNLLCWPGEVDSIKLYRAVMRGIQDSKAAVRYFRKNAAIFRIDPDYIFALGASAGAFNALGVGYMNWESERPGACEAKPQYGNWLGNLLLPDMGSVEGNGGNPDQPSSVRAVVSLSGAVLDPIVFEGPSDPPLLAFHGDADDVVPYGYDCLLKGLIGQGLFDKCIRVYGPDAYLPIAQAAGVDASLITFPDGGHGYTPEELDMAIAETVDFLCAQMPPPVAVNELPSRALVSLYPNPSNGQAVLRSSPDGVGKTWQLFDLNGRIVAETIIQAEIQPLDLTHLSSGLYLWTILDAGRQVAGKFVIE